MRETEGEATALAPDATPSLDLVFDLLSDSRRRYALYYLNDQPDGVATIENLTKNVIALERSAGADEETTAKTETVSGHDPGDGSADQRASVRMELQHIHLPKLEDAGILEQDPRSETVRYWGQPSVEEWLEHAQHKETA
jgi:DNA-binding transcriptional ArsR family regulator